MELFPPNIYDLARLAEETSADCPFCPDVVEVATPKLPPEIWLQGGVQRGRALLGDNLATQVDFAGAVLVADPASVWVSINANHVLPSGSSLFHPHTQGAAHPEPTTMQALLAAVPAER